MMEHEGLCLRDVVSPASDGRVRTLEGGEGFHQLIEERAMRASGNQPVEYS